MNKGTIAMAKIEKYFKYAKTLIKYVTIGPNVCIFDHDHSFKDEKQEFVSEKIVVEDHVWIGAGCIILKGVTIGKESVIAAGTVVTKDVSPYTVALQKRNTMTVPILGGKCSE